MMEDSQKQASDRRPAPSLDLLRIAGVSERDIDLLLLEEFIASAEFARWFLIRIRDETHANYSVAGAQRSVTESIGESDVLIVLTSGTDTKYLLIENKIAAGFQSRQAERYRARGREYQDKGLCSTYSTVLVAPLSYLGDTPDHRGFDTVLSYEDLLSWFAESSNALGPRARYKRALLDSAISKAKYGYQPVEDAPVTDFWRSYWRLATEVAPELEMQEPISKPSRAGFIYFRPSTLPRGVAVVHKLRHGLLDLQFAGLGRQLSKIRREFGDRLLPGMTIAQANKSGVIRQKVPTFNTGQDFLHQAENARMCLEQARNLMHWYLRMRESTDAV